MNGFRSEEIGLQHDDVVGGSDGYAQDAAKPIEHEKDGARYLNVVGVWV
jgi:hypothetical protein